MQVDPIKLVLKGAGTKRLKLKYERLLSNFPFKFNLRRYREDQPPPPCVCRMFPGTHDRPTLRSARRTDPGGGSPARMLSLTRFMARRGGCGRARHILLAMSYRPRVPVE